MADPSTVFLITNPENKGPRVEQIWMFISRDANGHENVLGSLMGDLGCQPLITGNPKTFEVFRKHAKLVARENIPGKTIHLLKFTHREEVEQWQTP